MVFCFFWHLSPLPDHHFLPISFFFMLYFLSGRSHLFPHFLSYPSIHPPTYPFIHSSFIHLVPNPHTELCIRFPLRWPQIPQMNMPKTISLSLLLCFKPTSIVSSFNKWYIVYQSKTSFSALCFTHLSSELSTFDQTSNLVPLPLKYVYFPVSPLLLL